VQHLPRGEGHHEGDRLQGPLALELPELQRPKDPHDPVGRETMNTEDLLKTAKRRRLDAMQWGNEALAADWSMAVKHLEQLHGAPDGFAVVTVEGAFVGIWRQIESAQKVLGRSTRAQEEMVRPMVFADRRL